MTNNKTTQPQAKFDPTKLEQLNVAKDYPMEPEEFRGSSSTTATARWPTSTRRASRS